ncbi:MAG: carbonic anhydrase family protein [Dehalococcoidia bacterium]
MDATTRYTRRAFNRRAAGWLSLGGLVLAGCGPSQEDLDAARADISKLDKRLTAIDGGKAPAKTTAKSSAAAKDAHGAKPGEPAHWSYEGKTGPAEWGSMDPANGACSTGATQSPIDLAATQPGVGGRTLIKWQPAGLTVVNNGHTIQADVEKGSLIEIDGQPFELVQFHFHAPSEHTLNGKPFAMETHFVHKHKDGGLAVVGVLHSVGGEAPALTPILGAMPKKADEKKPLPKTDLTALLPRERAMFRYAGSLTTPPCSEGVRWQVFQSPTSISDTQLRAFQELYKNNARPVQPLKARDVLKESA